MRLGRVVVAMVVGFGMLLGLGLGPPSALAASVVVGQGNYDCDQAGLAAAISTAATEDPNAPGRVTFDCPSPTNTITFDSNIDIGDLTNVVIDGSNGDGDQIVLDGNEATNFFHVVDGGNLGVQHITMQNGNVSSNGNYTEGGAIHVDTDGVLSVLDATFISNKATYGGAIDSDGLTLTISQSRFINNEAVHFTRAGGAIYTASETAITQSSFINNKAALGGAIFNIGDTTINQSSFINNEAKDGATINEAEDGGAIYNLLEATISQSSFIDNTATHHGGAIASDIGTIRIVASTFSGNFAPYGSTLYNEDDTTSAEIAWSTIIQPSDAGSPALYLLQDVTLTGVILGGEGDHCAFDGGEVTDSYSLANDASCGLTDSGSDEVAYADGLSNLALSPLATTTINGVEQTFYQPLGAPALDGGPIGCDTDIQDASPDLDQLGRPRPVQAACDIGALEGRYFLPATLCANGWTGSLRVSEDCNRSETMIELPADGPITICVNNWNGSASLGDNCSRSEHQVEAISNGSIPICINRWTGVLRVSDRCSRSERGDWL